MPVDMKGYTIMSKLVILLISHLFTWTPHILSSGKREFLGIISQLWRKVFRAICFSAFLIQGMCATKSGGDVLSATQSRWDEKAFSGCNLLMQQQVGNAKSQRDADNSDPNNFLIHFSLPFPGSSGTTVHLTQQDLQVAWVAVPYSCWCSPASLALCVRNGLGVLFCQFMLCQFQGNARSPAVHIWKVQ